MQIRHQLVPKLENLRLSGILETLDVRNRHAIEEKLSHVEFLQRLLEDEVERRAQEAAASAPQAGDLRSGEDPGRLRLRLQRLGPPTADLRPGRVWIPQLILGSPAGVSHSSLDGADAVHRLHRLGEIRSPKGRGNKQGGRHTARSNGPLSGENHWPPTGETRHGETDLAGIARRYGLTRARVTQLINLTLLAPVVQTEIAMASGTPAPVTERTLRPIIAEPA